MEEKMCGDCSQNSGLSLDKRIELALSRIPMQLYKCPICEKEHLFNRVIKETRKIETIVEAAKPKKQSKSKQKNNDADQLLLF